jgi:hypothetical protein
MKLEDVRNMAKSPGVHPGRPSKSDPTELLPAGAGDCGWRACV